jgi:hypothetical protein
MCPHEKFGRVLSAMKKTSHTAYRLTRLVGRRYGRAGGDRTRSPARPVYLFELQSSRTERSAFPIFPDAGVDCTLACCAVPSTQVRPAVVRVIKLGVLRLPFVNFSGRRSVLQLGWQPSGFFGAKATGWALYVGIVLALAAVWAVVI